MSVSGRTATVASETGGSGGSPRVTTRERGGVVARATLSGLRQGARVVGAVRAALSATARGITPVGWFVLAVAGAATAAGVWLGWSEWLAVGIAAALLLVVSAAFLFGARAYDVTLHLERERVPAGSVVPATLTVRNRRARPVLPGRVDLPVGDGLVEVGIRLLRAGQEQTHTLEVAAPRRGIVPVGPPASVRSDPVGLLRRERSWGGAHSLYVHPRTVPVPATTAGVVRDLEGWATREPVDDDLVFHAIRGYVPGDSRRRIHWASTAKTGALMVREFEQTRRARVGVVLGAHADEYADDDEFELAVSVAASLGVQAMRDGREVQTFVGSALPRPVRGRLEAIRTLTAATPSALLDGYCRVGRSAGALRVADVSRLAAESARDLSVVFVVSGSRASGAMLRRAGLAFGARTAVVAVICDERAHPRWQIVDGAARLTVGVLADLTSLLVRGAA